MTALACTQIGAHSILQHDAKTPPSIGTPIPRRRTSPRPTQADSPDPTIREPLPADFSKTED